MLIHVGFSLYLFISVKDNKLVFFLLVEACKQHQELFRQALHIINNSVVVGAKDVFYIVIRIWTQRQTISKNTFIINRSCNQSGGFTR